MNVRLLSLVVLLVSSAIESLPAAAEEHLLNGHRFTLPAGFSIELAAGADLVERPITADFDERGRLYVTESSGTNDPVEKQLAEKPHRILRLEDSDGDGKFDKRTIYADKLMFPEGSLWLAGSLYVSAPPAIWKFTDEDDDGVADRREIWFDGKTLTGCANDLHGPYAGRDGWIYWCKGAFAEQSYARPVRDGSKATWTTRAAHIFRRRPEGGPVEPVMTGGMDNPVDVVFTPGGERLFTTTFLQHPAGGNRDGIIHALYGGVYGKDHGVLEGHARTGELLPPLVHLGAAAPCGLATYDGDAWGEEYRDNVFAASFNMHKITRHELSYSGATFATVDSDFLIADNLDFHPTDVFADAAGDLIVVDTGGWYKLCCPTSQLWKPDVHGAIYRIKKSNAAPPADPLGMEIAWQQLDPESLASLLADGRPTVRQRSIAALAKLGSLAQPSLAELLETSKSPLARREAVWALCRIDDDGARAAALLDADETVRQAAIHAIGVHRDAGTIEALEALLASPSHQNRRAAAEALGRLGQSSSVPALLACAGDSPDRSLEHSLIYALIEIGDPLATRKGLQTENPLVRRAALIALDQMPGGDLSPETVTPLLASDDASLRETATWIVGHRPQWGDELVAFFSQRLQTAPGKSAEEVAAFAAQLAVFAESSLVQALIAETTGDAQRGNAARRAALAAMSASRLPECPPSWQAALASAIKNDDPLRQAAVASLRKLPTIKQPSAELVTALDAFANSKDEPAEARLVALASTPGGVGSLQSETLELLLQFLPAENEASLRSAAADALASAQLSGEQLEALAAHIAQVSPLEIHRVLLAFEKSSDAKSGEALLASLVDSPVFTSVRADALVKAFEKQPAEVRSRAAALAAKLNVDADEQRKRLEEVLASLPAGDVRRGQEVFHRSKTACKACHAMGYLGGNIGPDLSRIGGVRAPRDLLESILFPSLSFVRSYEPVTITTGDGEVHSGVVREETSDEMVLATAADKQVRIAKSEIEEFSPSSVSVMPAGLDKQLTLQEMADLLEFLKAAK
jgi:putative membrane-bound dehydrogenase-like protein